MSTLHELTVTIKLTRQQIVTLGGWASVSRTFDAIKSAADRDEDKDESAEQHREVAIDEMNQLHQPLSDLHMQVRQEIWNAWGPHLERIYQEFERKELTFDEAEKQLVELGVWRWKARESLRTIHQKEGP